MGEGAKMFWPLKKGDEKCCPAHQAILQDKIMCTPFSQMMILGLARHESATYILVARALEVRSFCEQHLLIEAFERDDNCELCELIIKYLIAESSVEVKMMHLS